jgi:hypothetical protein
MGSPYAPDLLMANCLLTTRRIKHMAKAKTAKTLDQFRAKYDDTVRVPTQIRAALASLLAEGRDAWEEEGPTADGPGFIKRCGDRVGNTHIAKYRDQFAKHLVKVREKGKNDKWVWFADPKVASKARGE